MADTHPCICCRCASPPPCVLCTPLECRYLNTNQLTGTLPAAWSALSGLARMWVACALLIRERHLAVNVAWHVQQASERCSRASSCKPAQGAAARLPASCLLVQISCLQRPFLRLPGMPLQHSCTRTAAQQLHLRALQPVLAVGVGGAYRKHDCHITLMIHARKPRGA